MRWTLTHFLATATAATADAAFVFLFISRCCIWSQVVYGGRLRWRH